MAAATTCRWPSSSSSRSRARRWGDPLRRVCQRTGRRLLAVGLALLHLLLALFRFGQALLALLHGLGRILCAALRGSLELGFLLLYLPSAFGRFRRRTRGLRCPFGGALVGAQLAVDIGRLAGRTARRAVALVDRALAFRRLALALGVIQRDLLAPQ